MELALTPSAAPTKAAKIAGYTLTGLSTLFLLMDGAVKFTTVPQVLEANAKLGIPAGVVPAIGALELALLALTLVPRTAILGAILFTGYLGGATAMHVRVGDPVFFPILIGAMLWGGLLLRDRRARDLMTAALR